MLNIPSWLLSDTQLQDLITTWRAVMTDPDATAPDERELVAFADLVAYARTRIDVDTSPVIVKGATL